MTRYAFPRDDAVLSGVDIGSGRPVVFQHGLGGDEEQVAEVFPDDAGVRRLTLECRAQGRSAPGQARRFSIATFTEDVLAFCDARGVDRFVAGGISMGAAIAVRLAVIVPERVKALVIARPAWLWDAAPTNMRPFTEVARLLREPDVGAALSTFAASDMGRLLAAEAPDNLASLKKFFAATSRDMVADLLCAISADGPGISADAVAALSMPTLVIGHAVDAVHPLAYARALVERIPGARLVEISPKAINKVRYVGEFRAALGAFLDKHA